MSSERAWSEPAELALLPAPRSIERGTGPALARTGARVVCEQASLEPLARALAGEIRALTGIELPVRGGRAQPNDLLLRIVTGDAPAFEAYELVSAGSGTCVSGSSARAVAWGSVTLLQLLGHARGRLSLPELRVTDAPDLPFRALLIDVARHAHAPGTLEQLIELCRFWKIAYLQLHLTDDEAFTFPSRAHPELATPGRHYALSELEHLERFASERGVTLVPELDVPGHAAQMVERCPELFCASPELRSTLDFASPRAMAALETLIGEICAVFASSPYFHIGGDEVDFATLDAAPSFRAAFAREGIATARELYRERLGRLNAIVKRQGKTTLVWEGFAPEGLVPIPRDVIVVAYEASHYPPDALARDGFQLINASWKPLYVVGESAWSPREIHAWNAHRWEHFRPGHPAYEGIQLAADAPVLGAMLCAWEQREGRQVANLRDRLAALGERLWRAHEPSTFEDFERRRAAADARLGRILGALS